MSPPGIHTLDAAGRLRRLFSDSVIYGSANAISKLFALVTFPLLARHLSVADYGLVDLFLVFANWLALVLILGIDSALARAMVDHTEDDERARIVSQALVWLAGLCGVAVPLLWMVSGHIVSVLGQAESAQILVQLVTLQLPLIALTSVAQALLRWTFQRRRFVILSLGASATSAFGLIVLFVATDAGPQHVFAVGLAVQSIFAVVAILFIRRWLVWPHSLEAWRSLLPMAVPLGLVSCIAAAVPMIERALVNDVGGAQALGLYAAGAKIAALLSLPILAFQSGWTPLAVAMHREPNAAHTYNSALLFFAWLTCTCAMALVAAGPWLILLLASERYAEGATVVLPLALALAVQGIGWILEVGITVSRRMHLSLMAYLAMLTIFLASSFGLARSLGPVGVAWGLLAGQVGFTVLSAKLAQRAHRIEWTIAPVAFLLGATLIVGLLQALAAAAWGRTYAAILAIAALAAIMVWGARNDDIRFVLKALRSGRPPIGS